MIFASFCYLPQCNPPLLATSQGDHVGSHTTPHTATTGAGEGALVIFGGRTEKLRELLLGGGWGREGMWKQIEGKHALKYRLETIQQKTALHREKKAWIFHVSSLNRPELHSFGSFSRPVAVWPTALRMSWAWRLLLDFRCKSSTKSSPPQGKIRKNTKTHVGFLTLTLTHTHTHEFLELTFIFEKSFFWDPTLWLSNIGWTFPFPSGITELCLRVFHWTGFECRLIGWSRYKSFGDHRLQGKAWRTLRMRNER